MGREIVYCDGCGDRILETEFEKGRAITLENKKLCFGCRQKAEGVFPSTGVMKAPRSGNSSSPPKERITTRTPGHSGTDRMTPPRKESKVPLLLGTLIAVVALGLLVWLMLNDSKKPENTPPSPAAKTGAEAADQKAAEAIRKLERLTRPAEVLTEGEKLRPDVTGTRFAGRFEELLSAARREKSRSDQLARFDAAVKKAADLLQTDKTFEKYDEMDAALSEAVELAPSKEQRLATEKKKIDANSAFNQYAQDTAKTVLMAANAYAETRRYQEAIDTIEKTFPPHLRKTSYWTDLQRKINEYREAAAKPPPDQPAPTRAPSPQRPTILKAEMPPTGKPFALFDGKSAANFTRYMADGEDKESWKVENGALVGTSSFKEGDKPPNAFDGFVSLPAEFGDFDLEIEVKVEKGALAFACRIDMENLKFGTMARIESSNTADWTKFTAKYVGTKCTVTRVSNNNSVDLPTNPVDQGRLGLFLLPGSKAYVRVFKVTPLKK